MVHPACLDKRVMLVLSRYVHIIEIRNNKFTYISLNEFEGFFLAVDNKYYRSVTRSNHIGCIREVIGSSW